MTRALCIYFKQLGVRTGSPATWSPCRFCCCGGSPRFGEILRVSGARAPGHAPGRRREGAGLGKGATHVGGRWRPLISKPGATASLASPPENLRLPASPPRLQAMWWSAFARRHHLSCPSPSIVFSSLLLTLSAHPATSETTPISILSQSSKGIPRSASFRSPLSRTAAGRAQTAQCGWGRYRPTLGAMIWTPSAS